MAPGGVGLIAAALAIGALRDALSRWEVREES
jgi:hypothetical protein